MAAFVGGQLVFLVAGSIAGVGVGLSRLPDVTTLQSWVPTESTQIFDVKGRLIANVHGEENREVVPLGEIPKTLQQAVIAVEDDRFYEHHGVNVRGIVRAALADLAEGGKVEGGSTITQQLAKNLFLTANKSIARKLADAWLAIKIENHYSKAQILEMYLNQVYWGHNCYGIQAAARNYFGKKTKDLTLAESAQLAFLLRGPERFSPYKDPVLAKRGQRIALSRMVKAGYITEAQAAEAFKISLQYPGIQTFSYRAPYYTSFLLSQLMNRYGSDVVMRGGLRVRATLDLDIQQKAEDLLKQAIATYGKRLHFTQGAIVVLDPRTGFIRAMVGGVDYNTSKFNRIIQAHRQPGSSFKPFVYLTAFADGISPGTV
ncbi:MAG TPA: transglycosylase domain-containing protein, partial [Stenomitos sp.]